MGTKRKNAYRQSRGIVMATPPDSVVDVQSVENKTAIQQEESNEGDVPDSSFTGKGETKPASLLLVIPAIPLFALGSWLIYDNFFDPFSFRSDIGDILVILAAGLCIKAFSSGSTANVRQHRIRKQRGA